jgi:hypothetical protein
MFLCNSLTGWQLRSILCGEKSQITIIPAGHQYKVGDALPAEYYLKGVECCLGDMVITDVIRYHGNLIFTRLDAFILEKWAKREGFSSFTEADKTYKKLYGIDWKERELHCLKFRGSWLPEEAV